MGLKIPQPSTQPSSMPSETPSANPSRSCENLRTDCGWGIFNPWTCVCDCAVGYCYDGNDQCYLPCAETINNNPFGGCSPGWDCTWFPDLHNALNRVRGKRYEVWMSAEGFAEQ